MALPTPEWRLINHQHSVTGGRIYSVQWEVLMVGEGSLSFTGAIQPQVWNTCSD